MDMLKRLNDAMAYLELHLAEPVDLKALGRIALCSPESFRRLFSYVAGIPLNAYLARRRLTRAAYELRDTDERVLDIAVRWGYNSADAFARAFTRQHGITPSQVRHRGACLVAYPPISFRIMIQGAEKMNVRIVECQPRQVWGVSKRFTGEAAERFSQEHEMWADECDHVARRVSRATPGLWYGLWNHGLYTIARELSDTDGTGLVPITIPGGCYAAFTTEKGGFAGDELPRFRQAVFGAWLSDSGYVQAEDFEMEMYHLTSPDRRCERFYELWILRKRV